MLKNPRHEEFCVHVAAGRSASEAYRRAFGVMASAPVSASILLRNPNVRARVQELRLEAGEAAAVTIAECVERLRAMAFADVRDLFNENGELLPVHEWDEATAAAVAGLDVRRGPHGETITKVRRVDQHKAFEMLMRYLGGFNADQSGRSNQTVVFATPEALIADDHVRTDPKSEGAE